MTRAQFEAQCAPHIREAFGAGLPKLGSGRVQQWILRPGMDFGSPLIWWGNTRKTRAEAYGGGPHEGIDFVLGVEVDSRRILTGMEGLPVPLFTAGIPLWRFADLVGETVIVATQVALDTHELVFQYSHLEGSHLPLGEAAVAGTEVGRIKRSENPKSATAAHLHVSTALLPKKRLEHSATGIDFDDWLAWEKEGALVYLDPLNLLSHPVRKRWFLTDEASLSPLHSIACSAPDKAERLHLRRLLARQFPGVLVDLARTLEDARGRLDCRGLIVIQESNTWTIALGKALAGAPALPSSGHGDTELVETVRQVEALNAWKPATGGLIPRSLSDASDARPTQMK